MNALSSEFETPTKISLRARVAVLVDGENISAALAGQVILKAAGYGDLIIKRVYANTQIPSGWDTAPGFRMMHSGVGKNATDLLLCVDAMKIMLRDMADVLVIVASDRDYTHLATNLCELGYTVIGLGETKAPTVFQKSCTRFIQLVLPCKLEPKQNVAFENCVGQTAAIDHHLIAIIKLAGPIAGTLLSSLHGRMHTLHNIKANALPEKTWRAYLAARPHLYACDPKAADAKVRLAGSNPAHHTAP